ncbi:A disintegrin and metalloproteinase with thrombospondin motifs 9-like [Tubulanus polymorphus]|uniref:A disintegrin and metalloproteinase with thrombospondin motifs 9-like n=1 Tax=Tubulanus polymorphus TaxID=672921 RepID=UPI003DA42155
MRHRSTIRVVYGFANLFIFELILFISSCNSLVENIYFIPEFMDGLELDGPYIADFRRNDHFGCVIECNLRPNCLSSNYHPTLKLCQLSDKDACNAKLVPSNHTVVPTFKEQEFPRCCKELWLADDQPDQEHVIYYQRITPMRLFCYQKYSEFITLKTGSSENYIDCYGSTWPEHGFSRFTKIRLDPMTLEVKRNDLTFATNPSTGKLYQYGHSCDCDSNRDGLTKMNLEQTGFKFAGKPQYVNSGYRPSMQILKATDTISLVKLMFVVHFALSVMFYDCGKVITTGRRSCVCSSSVRITTQKAASLWSCIHCTQLSVHAATCS